MAIFGKSLKIEFLEKIYPKYDFRGIQSWIGKVWKTYLGWIPRIFVFSIFRFQMAIFDKNVKIIIRTSRSFHTA